MDIGSGNIYTRVAIIPEKAANEAKSDDNGAKTGESCTISPVPAPDDTTMVQNYNLPKEE